MADASLANDARGFYLRDDFAAQLPRPCGDPGTLLQWAQSVSAAAGAGDVYRAREGRRTLRFALGQDRYFLKLHSGIGWRMLWGDLLRGRRPVVGARDEYRALAALARAGVNTLSVAAFASAGRNPARRRSLIVTDALRGTVSLEDACARWRHSPPPFTLRLAVVRQVATIARQMHGAGINHRDFYLCHFHLCEASASANAPRLYLIDLHRAQVRRRVPRRWRVKDLAALYFSALDCGLTRRDALRFIRHYAGGNLRRALAAEGSLWRQVERRAQRMQRRGARG